MIILFFLLITASIGGLLPGDGAIVNTGCSSGGSILGSGQADPNWLFAGPGASRFASDYSTWVPATTQGTAPALTSSRGLAGIPVQANLAIYGLYQQTFTASRPIAYITVNWQTDDYCLLFLNGALVYTDTCDYSNPISTACYLSTRKFNISRNFRLGANSVWAACPNGFGGSGLWAEFSAPVWAAVSATQELPATGRGANGKALGVGLSDLRWQSTPVAQAAPDGSATLASAWAPAVTAAWSPLLNTPSAAAVGGLTSVYTGFQLFRVIFNVSLARPQLRLRYSADDAALVYMNGKIVANDTADPVYGAGGVGGCGLPTADAVCACTGCISTCCWTSWQYLTLGPQVFVQGANTLLFAISNKLGGSGIFVIPEDHFPIDLDSDAVVVPPQSTGWGNAGALALSNGQDTNWRVYGPTPAPATVALAPFEWTPALIATGTAQPSYADALPLLGSTAPYAGSLLFETTFWCSSPSTATLALSVGSDDYSSAYLNSNVVLQDQNCLLTACGTACCYNSARTFWITSGFVFGVNTLRFSVTNAGGGAGLVVRVQSFLQPALTTLLPPSQQLVWATGNLPAAVVTQDFSGSGAGLLASGQFDNNAWQYCSNVGTPLVVPQEAWSIPRTGGLTLLSPIGSRGLVGPGAPITQSFVYRTFLTTAVASGASLNVTLRADDCVWVYVNGVHNFNNSWCCGLAACFNGWFSTVLLAGWKAGGGVNELRFVLVNLGGGSSFTAYFSRPVAFSQSPSPSASASLSPSFSASPSPPGATLVTSLLYPGLTCAANRTLGVLAGAHRGSAGAPFSLFTSCTSGDTWTFDNGVRPGANGGWCFVSPGSFMPNANTSCGATGAGNCFPAILYMPPMALAAGTLFTATFSSPCLCSTGTQISLRAFSSAPNASSAGAGMLLLASVKACSVPSAPYSGVLVGALPVPLGVGGGVELLVDPLGNCNCAQMSLGSFTATTFLPGATRSASASALPTPTPASGLVSDEYYPASLSCFDTSMGLQMGWRNASSFTPGAPLGAWTPFPYCNPSTNVYYLGADYSIAMGGYCSVSPCHSLMTNAPTSCSTPTFGWCLPSHLHQLPQPLHPGSTITLSFVSACSCGDGVGISLRALAKRDSAAPLLLAYAVVGATPPTNTTPCIASATVSLLGTVPVLLPSGTFIEVLADPISGCHCDGMSIRLFKVTRLSSAGNTASASAQASSSATATPLPSATVSADSATYTSCFSPSGSARATGTRSAAPSSSPWAAASPSAPASACASAPASASPTAPFSATAPASLSPAPSGSASPSTSSTLSCSATSLATRSAPPSASAPASTLPSPSSSATGDASAPPNASFSASASVTGSPSTTGTGASTAMGTGMGTPKPSPATTLSVAPVLLPSSTPSPTPTASVTATAAATPTSTLSGSSTVSASPTASLSSGASPSNTASTSLSSSATPPPSATPTGSGTGTAAATPTTTVSASSTQSASPTASLTAGASASNTASTSISGSATGSDTGTQTPTGTPSGSGSGTAAVTPSSTVSGSSTVSASPTASLTTGASSSNTASTSLSSSATPPPTPTPTPTPSATVSGTGTATVTPTSTLSSSSTLSASPTASLTAGATPSNTASTSMSGSATGSDTGTQTPTGTPSGSGSDTAAATPTSTLSGSSTVSASPTASLSSGASPSNTASTSLSSSATPPPTPSSTCTPKPPSSGPGAASRTTSSTASATGTPTASFSPTATLSAGASPSVTAPAPTVVPSLTLSSNLSSFSSSSSTVGSPASPSSAFPPSVPSSIPSATLSVSYASSPTSPVPSLPAPLASTSAPLSFSSPTPSQGPGGGSVAEAGNAALSGASQILPGGSDMFGVGCGIVLCLAGTILAVLAARRRARSSSSSSSSLGKRMRRVGAASAAPASFVIKNPLRRKVQPPSTPAPWHARKSFAEHHAQEKSL